jgi:hypothetical protein
MDTVTPVADDATTITARIIEIREEAKPRCPQNSGRYLHDCLRSSTQCNDVCPLKGDWIGPG